MKGRLWNPVRKLTAPLAALFCLSAPVCFAQQNTAGDVADMARRAADLAVKDTRLSGPKSSLRETVTALATEMLSADQQHKLFVQRRETGESKAAWRNRSMQLRVVQAALTENDDLEDFCYLTQYGDKANIWGPCDKMESLIIAVRSGAKHADELNLTSLDL